MDHKRLRALAGLSTGTRLELMESVIHSADSDDPWDPEVLVPGVGRYTLKQLKANVRKKLADLAQTAESDDPDDWDAAAWKLKNDAMIVMMDTIKAAHDELRKK